MSFRTRSQLFAGRSNARLVILVEAMPSFFETFYNDFSLKLNDAGGRLDKYLKSLSNESAKRLVS